MRAVDIRQSYLDFFSKKNHEVVTSASLLPESPNLLFTNAGMNQFVPYFLGDQRAPFARAVDTQKCIRAGGKHNDLEDVGMDTYHHTFFEMLGNWSFGDYFKKEAIEWAWELLVNVWGFPTNRLYATVYQPADGDPASFDEEAHEIWSEIFRTNGLDPNIHVVTGGKKDNFWMMGETGPCGPCSELHLDLTLNGDSKGKLVNADSHLCIEIWNLVFIQFNADRDGNFTPLKSKHVDTGMGFERVASVIQSTKNFTDFSKPASNYDTDIFRPIFSKLEELSGKTYQSTLPEKGTAKSVQQEVDIAFRVIADHLRSLAFSIADGILPGNSDRNYVLRRILRRAVKYGRTLGFSDPFFYKLVPVLTNQMGEIFPEIIARSAFIEKTLKSEEESFNKTLDRGIELFSKEVIGLSQGSELSGKFAFKLYDTFGFPLDLTELMAREKGLTINKTEFDREMNEQKKRAREAHKSVDVVVNEGEDEKDATIFCGYDRSNLENFSATCTGIVKHENSSYFVFDRSPFYAEMGGQVGDSGKVETAENSYVISNVIKDNGGRFLHETKEGTPVDDFVGKTFALHVDIPRRLAIQRHHTATHILHWALREVLGDHVRQSGSLVEENRLRFDFSHFEALTRDQVQEIEQLANEKVLQNDQLTSYEIPFAEKPEGVIAFFGDKYGDFVRVVDLGGWSMELCGGTHVLTGGEVGSIRIIGESAVAAGTRRIEAVAGFSAYEWSNERVASYEKLLHQLGCKHTEADSRIDQLKEKSKELEKKIRSIEQKDQASIANDLIQSAKESNGVKIVTAIAPSLKPDDLRALCAQISKRISPSITLLASELDNKCTMVCICSAEAVERGHRAGDYLSELAHSIGGKGGGKPDFAMGGASAGKGLEAAFASHSLNSLN